MKRSLISNKFLKELNISCFHYYYDNGLNVIYAEDNEYSNLVDVNITLLTPAINNKGITHVIEHCIASEANNKRFLKQYASTVQDKTSYEYILHVDDIPEIKGILSEVFSPKFKSNKNIFLREGWRIDSQNEKLFIRGIVYNEMLESFSSPMYNVINYIPCTLFSNSIYKNIAGGVPKDILDLQLEDIINYHNNYYKINNCVIYIHGYKCIDNILNAIEPIVEKYSCTQISNLMQIKAQQMVSKHNLKLSYPTINSKGNSFISINYVINKPQNQFEYNVYYHLVNFIIKNEEKLRKKIENDELLIRSTFKNLIYAAYFTVILRGKNVNNHIVIDEYQRFFGNIIKYFSSGGIPNYIKHDIKPNNEIDGLKLGKYIIEAFFSKLDPYIYLYKDIPKEQEYLFMRNICEYFLQTPTSSTLLVTPKKESLRDCFIEKAKKNGVINEYKIEKKKIKASYSATRKDDNKKYQSIIPDSENTQYKVIKLSNEYDIDCYVYNNNNSQEVSNLHFYFDITNFKDEQIVYLSILINYLEDQIQLAIKEEIKLYIYPINNNACKLVLRINAREEDLKSIMNSLIEILSLKNLEKNIFMIKEIINSNLAEFEIDIFKNTIFYLESRLTSHMSLQSFCKDYIFGIGNYIFMNDIEKSNIAFKLKDISKTAFSKNRLKVSVYSKNEECVLNLVKNFINRFEEVQKKTLSLQMCEIIENEAIKCSFQTNYIVQSFYLGDFGYKNYGKNAIISNVITDNYFLPMIREKNNAYGCGVICKEDVMTFYSNRDPNIESTLSIFKSTYNYMVKNVDLIYKEYKLYRRNFFCSFNEPVINERNDGITLKNIFFKRFKYKNDLIKETEDIDKKYILELAEMVRLGVDKNLFLIMGNEKDIKNNESIFSKINTLP